MFFAGDRRVIVVVIVVVVIIALSLLYEEIAGDVRCYDLMIKRKGNFRLAFPDIGSKTLDRVIRRESSKTFSLSFFFAESKVRVRSFLFASCVVDQKRKVGQTCPMMF